MSKAISLTIETQTENRELISLCHVNEKMLSLETSFVANKMFKMNKRLFDKINNTTRLLGGALYRQSVIKAKGSTNRTYNRVENRYESIEEEIAELSFENNILRRKGRAISKYKTKFDFDPTKISEENTGGYFDAKNPSPDDIRSSQMISMIEEIELFQNNGVKSFMFMDNLQKTKGLIDVGYRIELTVDTDFDDYVTYVIRLAEASLVFLTSYLNSLSYSDAYDSKKLSFNPTYTQATMNSLGLAVSMTNLNEARVRDSEFGKAAIAYYNLVSLLSENVQKSIYGDIMKIILPTDKTTPEAINLFLKNFNSILHSVKFEYLKTNKQSKKENKFSRVSEGRIYSNVLHATSKEKFQIDQEKLGYSVFSDEPGLSIFSSADYKTRFAAEQAKYYPRVDIADTSGFLTPSEQGNLSSLSNASTFLTPSALVMGDKRIGTNRGMSNIDVNEIRQFRLAKSVRAQQQNSTKFPQSTNKNKISVDSLSSLNVTISSPKKRLNEKPSEQEVDPMIDAKHYVGENVDFTTNNPLALIKNFRRIKLSEESRILSVASDIIPRRFLRNNRAINSIEEIQFSNPKSLIRKLALEGKTDFQSLPPHVKRMMSKSFRPNPDSDPLKNREASQIIQETQQNLFEIRVLTGFKPRNGFLDVHAPIYEQMDSSILSAGKPLIAKAFDYEVPELGIVKDNFLATIYSNLIYIRG